MRAVRVGKGGSLFAIIWKCLTLGYWTGEALLEPELVPLRGRCAHRSWERLSARWLDRCSRRGEARFGEATLSGMVTTSSAAFERRRCTTGAGDT